MINLKVWSAAAAMVLVAPLVVPTESFGQTPPGARVGGPVAGYGGAHVPAVSHAGPGIVSHGSYGAGGIPGAKFNGGAPPAQFGGGVQARQYNSGGGYAAYSSGGGYPHHHHRGGFIPGAIAGAAIGGAFASSYGYYGDPGYYGPGYYDDSYYDESAVVAAPDSGSDVAYCMQRFRSYDPGSGTYLGTDGYRHPCP